jgi:RecJ-like exonuclease
MSAKRCETCRGSGEDWNEGDECSKCNGTGLHTEPEDLGPPLFARYLKQVMDAEMASMRKAFGRKVDTSPKTGGES